jgi:uncharacterized membrane protein YccF (DUF307 family)
MGFISSRLWFVFGGFVMGLAWWLAGLLVIFTIVGIPWAKTCFEIGQFAFFPFGKAAINRKGLSTHEDIEIGALGLLGNVIWCIFAGVLLAIGHVLFALLCFMTLIGIPFGYQHLRLASLALAPIGKSIVERAVAEKASYTGI